MGIYKILHIKALKRRKLFLLEGINNLIEQLIETNKEIRRYERNK